MSSSIYQLAQANKGITKAAVLNTLNELTVEQLDDVLSLLQTMSNGK